MYPKYDEASIVGGVLVVTVGIMCLIVLLLFIDLCPAPEVNINGVKSNEVKVFKPGAEFREDAPDIN